MGNAVIPRRKGGNYATVEFESYEIPTLTKREAEDASYHGSYFAATAVGNYALFGGGYKTITVDAYDINLTHTIPASLNIGRGSLEATAGQNYALFAGGSQVIDNSTVYYSAVDVYSTTLTHTTTSLSENKTYLSAATVGNYSLFAGGTAEGVGSSDTVDVYDNNLVHFMAPNLSQKGGPPATTLNNYAIFARKTTSDVYSANLTLMTIEGVTSSLSSGAATSTESYALFGAIHSYTVNVYNSSLVRLTPISLSDSGSELVATTVGPFALFAIISFYADDSSSSVVEGFDNNLVSHQFEPLTEGRYITPATTLGKYALFGGGLKSNGGVSRKVDCYEYTSKDLELTLYKGARYKFQDMDAEATVEADMETKTIATPATGYIKFKKVTLS